jgi:hypothetical protein
MLRALLFGGFWCLAPVPIAFLLWPEFFPLTQIQILVVGVCYALAAAMALRTATRLPATSSWLIAIVGWVVGFNLVPFITGAIWGLFTRE